MSESPYWLIRNKHYEDTIKSLRFYGRTESEINEEYKRIKDDMERNNNISHAVGKGDEDLKSMTVIRRIKLFLRQLCQPTFYKPLFYLCGYGIMLEWSSFATLVGYLIILLQV